MDHFVGIDVSLDQSSVCIVDATSKIVLETMHRDQTPSAPAA